MATPPALLAPPPALMAPPQALPPVPPLFQPGHMEAGDERWFFNMKVHSPPSHNYPHPHHHPTTLQRNGPPLPPVRHSRASRGHPRASREQGRAAQPRLNRHRKLEAISTPSPAELREQIEIQTARSIGDSLIFHNIPERCDDTPEAEVVRFCQDYLVGQRIKHVQFGHVHKMEQRFAKGAPIAARFRLSLPARADQSETQKYQPLPYIPPVAKRRLPVLAGRSRRKTK